VPRVDREPSGGKSDREALFICWVRFHGRSNDLARAVGAEIAFVSVGQARNPRTAPFRWAVQTVQTILLLVRRRPRVLYVMAPPLPLVFLGLVYSRVAHARFVIDAHSAAVVERRTGQRSRRLFPLLARCATATIVTTDALATRLAERKVNVIAIHDPPMRASPQVCAHDRRHPRVMMPSSWHEDEPMDAVFGMARLIPEIEVMVTGLPRGTLDRAALPPNVALTGYLDEKGYDALLGGSDVVLALTTAENTMQRAGYEAMAYDRALVTSDTQALRSYFTMGTVFVDPTDAGSLAGAVHDALADKDELEIEMRTLSGVQREAFRCCLDRLAGLTASSPGNPARLSGAGRPDL